MATETDGISVRTDGGQKLFLLSLMALSVLGAVGFSVFIFGATSEFMASTTDRLYTAGIGLGMMAACVAGVYTVLN